MGINYACPALDTHHDELLSDAKLCDRQSSCNAKPVLHVCPVVLNIDHTSLFDVAFQDFDSRCVFLHGYTVIPISKTTKRLGSLNLSSLKMTLVLLVAHVLLKPITWNPTHPHSKKGCDPKP